MSNAKSKIAGNDSSAAGSDYLWTAKKRLLSLDGGGVRGVVTLAFLEAIEKVLGEKSGKGEAYRLADHFDLIGGTSTGAIIATGLATRRSVAELKQLYFHISTSVFRRKWRRIPFFHSLYGSKGIEEILRAEIGDINLDDPAISTYLAIISKRIDTGSPWIISTLPGQPFWEDDPDGAFGGNRHYNLADIVRASTAAPYFFEPETIPITKSETGRFIDGGVSPYNSPVLPLLMLAKMARFGLSWPLGPENLSMVSIGTGQYNRSVKVGKVPAVKFAVDAIQGLVDDCQDTGLMLMQWMSDQKMPWQLNSEILDLEGEYLGNEPILTFQRFNIRLDRPWLKEHCGVDVSEADLVNLRRIDNTDSMEDLFELAKIAAEKQVAQCFA